MERQMADFGGNKGVMEKEEEENSPVEQVALTVSTDDDPSIPVWTFRMWFLGILACVTLSFLNQFFEYRTEPIIITQISIQVAALPVGKFMARYLPARNIHLPLINRQFTLNPGPFSMKEHVLITIFANAGAAFGNGPAYAVMIINIIKAFYRRNIPFLAGWLIIITTQVLGYGWAGLFRKYVVDPAHMWWPSTLVQVSLFRALHEKDEGKGISRGKFFLIALICSFSYYVFPGYLFPTLTSISWVCWIWSRSVTAQQLGSGMNGLGLGAFTLDWTAVSAYLFSPMVSPFFTIMNVLVGYVLLVYIAVPAFYWGGNVFNAKTFPIYSSDLFTADGQSYNISAIVNSHFELDKVAYQTEGRIHLSLFFALGYALSFATVTSTITHVFLFYGKSCAADGSCFQEILKGGMFLLDDDDVGCCSNILMMRFFYFVHLPEDIEVDGMPRYGICNLNLTLKCMHAHKGLVLISCGYKVKDIERTDRQTKSLLQMVNSSYRHLISSSFQIPFEKHAALKNIHGLSSSVKGFSYPFLQSKKYPDIPSWWFYVLLFGTLAVSLAVCEGYKDTVQLPWWGLLMACALAAFFTLPISVITATTNQTPGLNVITEYLIGYILPGKPVANVCFKVYGYMSMSQAISFLSDFKLGHYMKIPPRSMFLVQFIGTILAGTVNLGVAWWLLETVENICQKSLLPPNSPWTCPSDHVFYDASVIWGLVGPKRIFGKLGVYPALNWFFFGGAVAPVAVWLLHKAFPKSSWIPLINMPVLLGATSYMPPATSVNYTSWILVGTIFNFFVFRYRKTWWQRYNYVLSAALDAGLAFMGVLLYFSLSLENKSISWWGTDGEHCPLAICPTAKGIQVDGCPVY
eukprot:Gb_01018 [translate_table: standard]